MSNESSIPIDDPDTYFIESSVPDVRAFEQKTRNDIETQKKELRAMVGEQYLDLISAADAIITMSKNAQTIQTNFERMQAASDVESIKLKAKRILQERGEQNNQTRIDTNRRYVYIIAALVKALADVPEQIWHALENHRYLHASRLFTLAKQVHEYLEEEKEKSTIDIEVAFPVIQRQWDAVSAFGPQIVQRSIHYLRVSEQSPEHIAEIMVGLMLLDGLSYKDTAEKFLEMRFSLIRDMIGCYTKGMDSTNNRATHQLREATLIIKRTLQQIYEVFFSKEGHTMTLIESYVTTFQKTFLIPAHKSHGNETPSQSAITRLFSPSSNVHLIVRYLPDSLQNYLPDFDPMPHLTEDDVQKLAKMWTEQIETLFKEKLHDILSPIQNQVELIQVRQKLWDLLDEDENTKKTAWQKAAQNLLGSHYSIWDGLYREGFNYSFKSVIDKALNELSNQPNAIIWPLVTDPVKLQQTKKDFFVPMHIWPGADAKQQSAFTLPNFASSKEIETFKASLKETANDRTETLCKLQTSFDSCLAKIRIDVQAHLIHFDHDNFHVKSDTDMIKSYFQDNCYEAALKYSANVNTLIGKVTLWTDKKKRNELSIFLGRLTRNIALLSKELPKSLLLSAETTPIFELRSRINKDPNYTTIQTDLIRTFHQAHDLWIDWLEKEFAQKLRIILATTNWNDQCASISIWENIEEDIKLPTQATNATVRSLFYVCEEIQNINSAVLDQPIMIKLRQQLQNAVDEVFDHFLSDIETADVTENGSLQLLFDYLFLNTILHNTKKSIIGNKLIQRLQDQIDPINWDSYEPHVKPCVNKFYIKQSLIFGVLTSATNETYERARKVMANQQQGQYNVLPLASQATRFTLLPIGHLTSSSVRTRYSISS